ncbi:MAG: DUF6600 domain-containing protein [Bacteroidia bacterium]
MKTLKQIITGICLASLSSCTVYQTAPTSPPPPPPVAEQPPPPPPPAPAPAPTYNTVNNVAPAPAPAPTYNTVNSVQPAPVNNYSQPVTVQSFYDELAPYGQWVNYGAYGYVWMPAAGPDFTPYSTAGHWVYTEYGWTWASDYPWGWAPFHYGRWEFDAYYGWFWIPDTQWGPAWVSWRSCNGYYGWAPLGYGYGWNNYNAYNPPAERWVFVQQQYMNDPYPSRYYVPRQNNNVYYSQSAVITRSHYDNEGRVTYAAGPDQNEVSRATGQPVTPVRLAPASRPGSSSYGNDGSLSIYRPSVASAPVAANAPKPAPARVSDIKEVQPVTQRPVMSKPEPAPTRGQPDNGQHMQQQQQEHQEQQQQEQHPAQQQQPQHNEPQQQPAQQHSEPAQQPQQQPAQQHQAPAQQQQQPSQQNGQSGQYKQHNNKGGNKNGGQKPPSGQKKNDKQQ